MTVVNPKSISGINSITTGSGSDNLLTIHTSDASSTERVRINSSGDVIVGSGITVSPDGDIFATGVTTSTTFVGALTGNVTGNATGLSGTPNISAGTIAGSTGTFTGDVDIADKIVHTGDTDTAIRFSGADTIQFETGGSSRLQINSIGHTVAGGDLFADADLYMVDYLKHTGDTNTSIRFPAADIISFENAGSETARFSATNQFSVGTTADITGANVAIGGSVRLVNATGQSATISALPSGTYNTGVSGGSAIVFHRFSDAGGGSDEIAFETHHQGTRHGEAARFNKTGNLAFPSGQGIDFSATGDGSGTDSSELFDDYEEGTWTPQIVATAANPNITYLSGYPKGYYTKVGKLVTLWYDISWNALPSQGGGTLIIQNFPYSTDSSYYHGFGLMSHTVGTTAGSYSADKHMHYANASAGFMYILTGSSTNGHMQATALNTSGHIFGGFTYRAT